MGAPNVITGWRARVRLAVRLALVAALALAIVGIVVETHRPCVDDYHPGQAHVWGAPRHVTSDMTLIPVALLALALVGQGLAHRVRLIPASVLGLFAGWAAINALMDVIWIHARAHTIEQWFIAAPALLAAAAVGLSQPLVELWTAQPGGELAQITSAITRTNSAKS